MIIKVKLQPKQFTMIKMNKKELGTIQRLNRAKLIFYQ